MQGENVIYFKVHILYADRKENIVSIDTDKRRLSQVQTPQNMRGNLSPEHIFNQLYDDLQNASQAQLGWQWLLPLRSADIHHLQSLGIPATNAQQDFDGLVLSLAKILIDSLNEESLKKLIPCEKWEAFKDKRGIALLEAALSLNELKGADVHVAFLRKLQSFRASGSVHQKEHNYLKVAKYFDFGSQSPRNVFANILNSASDTLDYFIALVNSGRIRDIFEKNQIAIGYAGFSDMIGIADFGTSDASVNHDEAIYELQSKS